MGVCESLCFEPPLTLVSGLAAIFFGFFIFSAGPRERQKLAEKTHNWRLLGGAVALQLQITCLGTQKGKRQALLRSSHVCGSLGKNVLCRSHFTRQGSDSPPSALATDLKIETSAVIECCVCARGVWSRLTSKEVLGEDCTGDSWPG